MAATAASTAHEAGTAPLSAAAPVFVADESASAVPGQEPRPPALVDSLANMGARPRRPAAAVPTNPVHGQCIALARSGNLRAAPALPTPGASDWLATHNEPGQSLAQFKSAYGTPVSAATPIALVTLGDGFSESQRHALATHVQVFFGLPVQHDHIPQAELDAAIKAKKITSRKGSRPMRQLWTGDCIEFVHARSRDTRRRTVGQKAKPAGHPVATMAVTMEDLTKNDDWNFLYGMARPGIATGVTSLARFGPEFNMEPVSSPAAAAQLVLHRALKVVTHEIGHLLGLKHCIDFDCLMNGVNHLGELRKQRILECPCCTAKLASRFAHWKDLRPRYEAVAGSLEAAGFSAEAANIRAGHLHVLNGSSTTAAAASSGNAPPAKSTSAQASASGRGLVRIDPDDL